MSFIPKKTMTLLRAKNHIRRRDEVNVNEPVTLSGSYSCSDKDGNPYFTHIYMRNCCPCAAKYAYSAALIGVFANYAEANQLVFNGTDILWDQYDSQKGFLEAIYDGLLRETHETAIA